MSSLRGGCFKSNHTGKKFNGGARGPAAASQALKLSCYALYLALLLASRLRLILVLVLMLLLLKSSREDGRRTPDRTNRHAELSTKCSGERSTFRSLAFVVTLPPNDSQPGRQNILFSKNVFFIARMFIPYAPVI